MTLKDIAHSRTGDKGNISTISLISYKYDDYEFIKKNITAEVVLKHFAGIADGPVDRYEVPSFGALNFVIHNSLGGGVTRSLRLDKHGKSLSSYLLDLEIDDFKGNLSEEK